MIEEFDHITLIDSIPGSIYDSEPEHPIRKLETIFAQRDNDFEALAGIDYWDPDMVNGVQLDKIAKLLGIGREGKTDSEFLDEILAKPILSRHKVSIPELLDLANILVNGNGTARVESLWAPGETRFYWNRSTFMSGQEPMSPRYRSAALRWMFDVGIDANFRLLIEAMEKARASGVGLYYEFSVTGNAAEISGPGGTGSLVTPASPDEVVLIYKGIEQSRFPVITTAGLCSFPVYETLAPDVDEIILFESSSEIGRFTVRGLRTDSNIQYRIQLEGLNGA